MHLVASVPEQVRSRGLAIGIVSGSFPRMYVVVRRDGIDNAPNRNSKILMSEARTQGSLHSYK